MEEALKRIAEEKIAKTGKLNLSKLQLKELPKELCDLPKWLQSLEI